MVCGATCGVGWLPTLRSPAVRKRAKSAASSSSGTNATYDMHVRQDNYYPVKSVVKPTGADQGTITIDYTGVNTSATIALRPASNVQSA